MHGYDAYEESRATLSEALKAEYEALTGEAYRSREEEQAANLEAAKERRQLRIEAQSDSDRQIIADAKANGFLDCRAIRERARMGQAERRRAIVLGLLCSVALPLDRGSR